MSCPGQDFCLLEAYCDGFSYSVLTILKWSENEVTSESLPDMNPVKIRRAYIDTSIGQIHIRIARPMKDYGKIPLVCFHMSPNTGRIYDNFMSEMAQDRLTVAPDTPGFGYSDRTKKPPEITDYAAIFIELLDALDLPSVDVMGYHTGAMIAVELARMAPRRVRRVVAIAAPIFDAAERDEFRDKYAHRKPERDGSHVADYWRRSLYWYEQGNGSIDDLERYFPDSLLGGTTAWWGHRAAFNYILEDALKEVTQPLLLINPHDDLEVYTLKAAPYLQNARMYNAAGWGHCFLDSFKTEAAELVRSFLDAPDSDPFGSIAFVPSAKAAWNKT